MPGRRRVAPAPPPREVRCSSLSDGFSNVSGTKTYVTIEFDVWVGLAQRTSSEVSGQRKSGAGLALPIVPTEPHRLDGAKDDLIVRAYCFFLSMFARVSDGRVDQHMEDKFAHNKYKHFAGAFMQISFLMPFGVVGQALFAALEEYWIRAGILLGFVAPMYMVYALFVLKHESKYFAMSGTALEKLLVGSLCLQSLSIIAAEFMRARLDYGMLVMHIGFVHNFSPLSESAIHLVTSGFGLFPYIILKLLRFLEPSISVDDEAIVQEDLSNACSRTAGVVTQMLEILMPTVILLYQSIVTMGRFNSMRIDLLSGEQLKNQRSQLKLEKQKVEGLLTSMLPRQIIESLKANESIDPQLYSDVTVIFVQICDFHRLCMHFLRKPEVMVEVLNILYLEFDRLSDMLHVYKVETVGAVYMAVVGCPVAIDNHADVAAHFALAVQESMTHSRARIAHLRVNEELRLCSSIPAQCSNGQDAATVLCNELADNSDGITLMEVVQKNMINVRVGLNSGRLRAGVVGLECPRYKLVGDTVNTASRMESTCLPGRIQVSASTRDRLTPGMFLLEERGEVLVKGKGSMRTAFLTGYADCKGLERRVVVIEHGSSETGLSDDLGDEFGSMGPTDTELTGPPQNLDGDPGHYYNCSGGEDGNPHLARPVTSRGASRPSAVMPLESSKPPIWRQDFSRYGVLEHAGAGEIGATGRHTMAPAEEYGFRRGVCCIAPCDYLSLLFLLMPPSQKQPDWMDTLRVDKPRFLEDTLHKRISSARNITIIWLLILDAVSVCDLFLDVLAEDTASFRRAILFRAVGNNAVGLVYLLLITNKDLFRRHAQSLTISMLVAQGIALLVCGSVMYNSDPAIIAMYGAYVLFYKVCTVRQRLTMCALAVMGYIIGELTNCGFFRDGAQAEAGRNIAFLLMFFIFVACGVRLEEHLEHVAHFEQRRVAERLEEIKEAKAAGSRLLESLLPPHVVDLVAAGVSPIAEHHSDVTIMFTDIKGFTAYSAHISPQEIVDLLNAMYSAFDEIIVNWELYKVEIIGDAYCVSAGCPPPQNRAEGDKQPDMYAMRTVEVGLALQRALPTVCERADLAMRVGIHSGPVVAGVVGKKGPRYHLFGAAVGYAEKMESSGLPGRVHISDATHALLILGGHDYEYQERRIEIEGELGLQTTWLVNKSNNKTAIKIQKEILMQRRISVRG